MRLLPECMQNMNSVAPTDYVENSERTTAIPDPNFPNAAADTCERSTMQWLFAKLQQVEFTANVDTGCSGEIPDDF